MIRSAARTAAALALLAAGITGGCTLLVAEKVRHLHVRR